MRISIVTRILLVTSLFLAATLAADEGVTPAFESPRKEQTPAEKEREFLSDKLLAELKSAKRFKAHRIGNMVPRQKPDDRDGGFLSDPERWPSPEPPNWFQWSEVLATAEVNDPALLKNVVDLLSSPTTYDFTDVSTVSMNTRFGLRLETEHGPLDVQFDFDGNGVTICTNPPGEGIWVGANFLPGRPKVVGLMKRLFPNDTFAQSVSDEPDRIRRTLGDVAEVLTNPDRVDYLRIGGEVCSVTEQEAKEYEQITGLKLAPPPPTLLSYEIVGKGKAHDPKLSTALGELLTAESTYGRGDFFCFHPGVGYRFIKGDRSVAVLVCFECMQVALSEELKGGKVNEILAPTLITPDAYDRVRELSKQAFPDDPEIQHFQPSFEKKK